MNSSSKTILHVIDTHGPGGGETVLLNLLDNFSEMGYRLVVVIKAKGWLFDSLSKRKNVRVHIAPSSGSFNIEYLKKLVRIIKREKVDLIHSHYLGPAVYCAIASLLTRKPVISTIHGQVDISQRERFKWLKYFFMNIGIKKIVSVSSRLKEEILSETSIKRKKVEVIYNGTVSNFQSSPDSNIRRELNIPESRKLVCSVGNIRPAKAYDVLLNVASSIAEKNNNIEFLIVGEGGNKLHKSLIEQQKQLGLTDIVHFLGFREDVNAIMRASNLFLLCSKNEGFSLTTIEAMAARIPVIATRCGGPEEIILDGKTGFLVENGNVEKLQNKVIQTLKNDDQEMLDRGFERVQRHFSVESMSRAYEEIYQKYW